MTNTTGDCEHKRITWLGDTTFACQVCGQVWVKWENFARDNPHRMSKEWRTRNKSNGETDSSDSTPTVIGAAVNWLKLKLKTLLSRTK